MNKELSYLTSLFGASGSEGDVRQAILNEVRDYCDRTEVDRLGNVIAFKRGAMRAPFTMMLCAHMDEVALMITSIEKDGSLRFGAIGGIDPRILPGKHVVIGRKKYHGVIGVLAPHLRADHDDPQVQKIEALYIDIGANDEEDARRIVAEGDVVGFESDYQEFGDGLVRAKALDDRVGCYTLLNLIKRDLPVDLYFVFTVMEEIGCAGAGPAAFGIKPRYALVLESTTAGDIHTDENKTPVCRLGEGPVISFMDNTAIYDRKYYALAMETAKEEQIPVQCKQAVAGGNESGTVQRTLSGCKTLTISAPCRYIHSPVNVASLRDIENMERLAYAIIKKLGLGAIES